MAARSPRTTVQGVVRSPGGRDGWCAAGMGQHCWRVRPVRQAARAKKCAVTSLAGRTIVVGGGARSGKSRFALGYARGLGARRAFVATAQALDEEMRTRIASHRDERGDAFATIEAPVELPAALAELDADVVVVDCLTLW